MKLFIRSQLCIKPVAPPKNLNLTGQTGIITGANSGIGMAEKLFRRFHIVPRLTQKLYRL